MLRRVGSSREQLRPGTCQCRMELADPRRSDLWQGKLRRPLRLCPGGIDCQVFDKVDEHQPFRQRTLLARNKRPGCGGRSFCCHQRQLLQHEFLHLHHSDMGGRQGSYDHSPRGICTMQRGTLLQGRRYHHRALHFFDTSFHACSLGQGVRCLRSGRTYHPTKRQEH